MCTLRGHKVSYPTPFEAVLRTERALLSNFQACRTLQSAGVIWTVHAYALLRPSRSFRHVKVRSGKGLVVLQVGAVEALCPEALIVCSKAASAFSLAKISSLSLYYRDSTLSPNGCN